MKLLRHLIAAAALVLAVAADISAQAVTDPAAHLASQLRGRARQLRSPAAQPADRTISLMRDLQSIFLSLNPRLFDRAPLTRLEEARTDKQLGSSGATAGSTSLVVKGGVPGILALAVENGALAQTTSGTTVTFRGTPVGIIKALADKGYFDTYEGNDPAVKILQRFSFAASFDTSRGIAAGDQPALTGDKGQLSAISGRLSLVDHRDPRQARYDDRWSNFSVTQVDLTQAAAAAAVALTADAEIQAWLARANAAVAAVPDDEVEAVVFEQFRALGSVPISENTRAAVTNATSQFAAVLAAREEVLREIEGGSQLVLDYTYEQPSTGPRINNIRLVGSIGRVVQLTGNASATVFAGSLPNGVEEGLRDVQAAVQLDVPMGAPDDVGRFVLSFSGRFQRVLHDLPADAGVLLPGTKGTIGVGQIKLTIPVKNLAAKIPLSVTFANRSELVREKVVRGNIGFTYDLDAVFARFKP